MFDQVFEERWLASGADSAGADEGGAQKRRRLNNEHHHHHETAAYSHTYASHNSLYYEYGYSQASYVGNACEAQPWISGESGEGEVVGDSSLDCCYGMVRGIPLTDWKPKYFTYV